MGIYLYNNEFEGSIYSAYSDDSLLIMIILNCVRCLQCSRVADERVARWMSRVPVMAIEVDIRGNNIYFLRLTCLFF